MCLKFDCNDNAGPIGGMGCFTIETFHKSTNAKHIKDDGERHIKLSTSKREHLNKRVLKGEI